MEKKRIGNSELETSPIVFGGNVFGWTADEATSFALLDAFVDAGYNCVDTADVYSAWVPGHKGGESEEVIGRWLKRRGRRDDVVIATKVGSEMGPDRKGLSKSYILRAAEDSLRRLETDYIDLYQSHRDDVSTPVEETLEAYTRLIEQGKVRAVGASNFDVARLKESLDASEAGGFASYVSLQPNYNLYDRSEFEGDVAELCLQRNVGVITYFSLAAGFLTGKYRSEADLSKSPRGGGIKRFLDERGFKILGALDEVSKELGATPAQVALAWLIAQPAVTAPIASATSLAQLQELLKAPSLSLGPEQLAKLDSASKLVSG
jgi:aryl-alcohol dehydrogenase-like predicted oxidoreductase